MKITVQDLETMDRTALAGAWDETFGTLVPKRLSKPFMRRFIAFELQARAEGRVPKSLRNKLKRLAATPPAREAPRMKAGSRLVREWKGVTHVVDVMADGFQWQGKAYRSLTAIAREITGVPWSGPRFFGLKRTVTQ